MAGLVVGGAAALLRRQHHVAGSAELHLLQRVSQVAVGDVGLAVACRRQRRLVDEVGQIRTGHARCGGGEPFQIHVGGQHHRTPLAASPGCEHLLLDPAAGALRHPNRTRGPVG